MSILKEMNMKTQLLQDWIRDITDSPFSHYFSQFNLPGHLSPHYLLYQVH